MSNIINMFEHSVLEGKRMIQTGDFFTDRNAVEGLVHCVALDSVHDYVRALWLTPGHEERIIEHWSWNRFRRVNHSEVRGTLKGLECNFEYRGRRYAGPIFYEEKKNGVIKKIAIRINTTGPAVGRNLDDNDIVITGRGLFTIRSRQ